MERRIRRHSSRLSERAQAALGTGFTVGQRIRTIDGLIGRILLVSESFAPGNTEYQVVLDNGMGGGTFLASQLRPVPEGYGGGHQAPAHLPAGLASLDDFQAADIHLASEDYPEMGSILHDRPDPGKLFTVVGSRHTAAELPYMAEPDDSEIGEHISTRHGMDPENLRYGNAKHWHLWHAAEHRHKTGQDHQHEAPSGTAHEERFADAYNPGEEFTPDTWGYSGGHRTPPGHQDVPPTGPFIPLEQKWSAHASLQHMAVPLPHSQLKLFHMEHQPRENCPECGYGPGQNSPEEQFRHYRHASPDYEPDECEHCGHDLNDPEEHSEHHQDWLNNQDWYTDWSAEHPKETLHRGIGLDLPSPLHEQVHDESRPVHERAHALLSHVLRDQAAGSPYGGLGNYWSDDPDVSKAYAESATRRYSRHNDQTPVMLHVHTPPTEHIETDPDELREMGVYSYHLAGNREVPVQNQAPLKIKGISWAKPGHGRLSGAVRGHETPEHLGDDPAWTHHEFGEEGIRAHAATYTDGLDPREDDYRGEPPVGGIYWEAPGEQQFLHEEFGPQQMAESPMELAPPDTPQQFAANMMTRLRWLQQAEAVNSGQYVTPPSSGDEMLQHLKEMHGVRNAEGKTPGVAFLMGLHSQFHAGQVMDRRLVGHQHHAPPAGQETEPGHNLSRFFTQIPAEELEAQQRAREEANRLHSEPIDDREYSINDVSRHYDWEGFSPHEIAHLVRNPGHAVFTHEDVPVQSLRHMDQHGRLVSPPSYHEIASQGEDEQGRLDELERGYNNGDHIPPVVVVRHGEHHIIADGSHRAAVYAHHGYSHIPAFVTERDIFPGQSHHATTIYKEKIDEHGDAPEHGAEPRAQDPASYDDRSTEGTGDPKWSEADAPQYPGMSEEEIKRRNNGAAIGVYPEGMSAGGGPGLEIGGFVAARGYVPSWLRTARVPWTPAERENLHSWQKADTATEGDFVPSTNFTDPRQHAQHAYMEQLRRLEELQAEAAVTGPQAWAMPGVHPVSPSPFSGIPAGEPAGPFEPSGKNGPEDEKEEGEKEEGKEREEGEEADEEDEDDEPGEGIESEGSYVPWKPYVSSWDHPAESPADLDDESGIGGHYFPIPEDVATEEQHAAPGQRYRVHHTLSSLEAIPAAEKMLARHLTEQHGYTGARVQAALARGNRPSDLHEAVHDAGLADHTHPRLASLGEFTSLKKARADEVYAQLAKDYPPDAIDWVHDVEWSGPHSVPLDEIDWQHKDKWNASHEPGRVDKFEKKIEKKEKKGKHAKPAVLISRPGAPNQMVGDGHHRALAYERLGQPVWGYTAHATAANGPWDEMHSKQFSRESGGGGKEGQEDEFVFEPEDEKGSGGKKKPEKQAQSRPAPRLVPMSQGGMSAAERAQKAKQRQQLPRKAALRMFRRAALSAPFRFEFTASWQAVVSKAKAIRSSGGVRITAVQGATVLGDVRGDHGTYHTGIQSWPGRPQSIASWTCSCPWAEHKQDLAAGWAGRPCSHAMALKYEAQSRRMFGGELRADPPPDPFAHAAVADTAYRGRHEREMSSAWDEAPEDDTDYDYYPPGVWEAPARHAREALLAAGEKPADVDLLCKIAGMVGLEAAANDPWSDNNYAEHLPAKPYGATQPPRPEQSPASYGPLSAPDPENWGEIDSGSVTQTTNISSQEASKHMDGYCLVPGTRVLTKDLRWQQIELLEPGDELIGFEEQYEPGHHGRRFRTTKVLSVKFITRPCVRLITSDGTSVVSSTEHKWLVKSGSNQRWTPASRLHVGTRIASIGTWTEEFTKEAGWLAGMYDGEGWVYSHSGPRKVCALGVSQNEGPIAEHLRQALKSRGFSFTDYHRDPHLPEGESNRRFHIQGGISEELRLLGMIRPERLVAKAEKLWDGRQTRTGYAEVVSKEKLDEQEVVAVQTDCGTFIAEGWLSHNCAITSQEASLRQGSPQSQGVHLIPFLNQPQSPAAMTPERQDSFPYETATGGSYDAMAPADPDGIQSSTAELHDQPEPALPEVTGDSAGTIGGGDAPAEGQPDEAALSSWATRREQYRPVFAAVRPLVTRSEVPTGAHIPDPPQYALDAATTGGGPGLSPHDEDLSPEDVSIQAIGTQQWSGGDYSSGDLGYSVEPHENPAEEGADHDDIVAQFQRSAAARHYMGQGAPAGDGDIARAAKAFLSKTADVLPEAEAQELIREGRGIRARNLGLLDLKGTHYEDELADLERHGINIDDFDDDCVTA
jgi:hypothetical protein